MSSRIKLFGGKMSHVSQSILEKVSVLLKCSGFDNNEGCELTQQLAK